MRNENVSQENISTKQILQERESVKNISKENRIEFSGKLRNRYWKYSGNMVIFWAFRIMYQRHIRRCRQQIGRLSLHHLRP